MNGHAFGSPLHRVAVLLAARLEALEARIRDGNEVVWPEYRETARALVEIQRHTEPAAEYLTTKEAAARLQVSPKTLLRRVKRGQLAPAVKLGHLIRWKAPAGASGGNAGGNGALK